MTIIRIGSLEFDLDEPLCEAHSAHQIMLRLFVEIKHLQQSLSKIERQQKMIAQQIIDDTGKALQDAANNIINHLPGNTTPSTPDASVQGLISVVQSVTSQLNAAAGPATPTVVSTTPPQSAA